MLVLQLSLKQKGFAEIILIVSLLLLGLFYEVYSCAASVAMLVWLLIKLIKKSEIKVYLNLTSISICIIVFSYLISSIWAIDSGMALIGFIKFLPILLFILIIMQKKNNDDILQMLPIVGVVITIISSIGMQFSSTEAFFSVDGRLAGFFQYPNTFALFLLIAELIILSKEKHSAFDYISFAVLIFGILYTGSRTVFILFALSNIILFFSIKNKKFKLFTLAVAAAAIIIAVTYVLLSGNTNAFTRFLTISITDSSTFIGRLLYFQDALPVLLKHPFGLGYMGYYYIQQSIQTGVYSVLYIHNDFLQLLLDIGWIPCGLFIAAIIKSVFSKNIAFYKKVMLCTIALHSCMDFNLQFIAVFFVMILFMDYNAGKEISVKKGKIALSITAAALIAVCIYFGTALAFYQLGKNDASHNMYSFNTQNEIVRLADEEDIKEANKIADTILKQNKYVTLAYSAKARYFYNKGDFQKVISYKNQIFENAPFAYEEYEEYCYMLINGISLYHQAGDYYSESVCIEELINTKQKLDSASEKLSKLGSKIQDQPETELPQEIEEYISMLEKAQ